MRVGKGGAGLGARVDDKGVEIFLGKMLRWGVLLAALVVFGGGVCFLAESRDAAQNYRTFR